MSVSQHIAIPYSSLLYVYCYPHRHILMYIYGYIPPPPFLLKKLSWTVADANETFRHRFLISYLALVCLSKTTSVS